MPVEEFSEKDFEVDHFAALGCEFGASEDAVKKAYKKLALQLHPDKSDHPMALPAMQALNAAYDKTQIDPNAPKPKPKPAPKRPGARR